jgi:curved DNA-binding protein
VVEASEKAAAEEKFKEINEAYEVLGDEEKRRKYDELGVNWNRPGGAPQPGGGFDYNFGGDAGGFSDFFEQFFGGGGFGRGGGGGGVSVEDLFGGGMAGRSQPRSRRGGDMEMDALVTLEEALHGATRTIRFRKSDPNTGESEVKSLNVKIPAGAHPGQKIRVPGQGRPGDPPGDLFIHIKFAQHPDFTIRENGDLAYYLELAPWEAILGTTVRLPTPDGPVAMKIKPGTEGGKKLRLRGKGMLRADKERADLLVNVSIQVPESVTDEERALWEQLAKLSTFKPHT